jgi:hypothetical protein
MYGIERPSSVVDRAVAAYRGSALLPGEPVALVFRYDPLTGNGGTERTGEISSDVGIEIDTVDDLDRIGWWFMRAAETAHRLGIGIILVPARGDTWRRLARYRRLIALLVPDVEVRSVRTRRVRNTSPLYCR